MRTLIIVAALILAAVGGYAFKEFAVARNDTASDAPPLTQDQLNQAIGQYLKDHPEEIVASLQAAQDKVEQQKQLAANQALTDGYAEIFNNAADPVLGNPAGDVTVVEFFDYRCPYCKRVTDSLTSLIDGDANVRVVFKEFPILGPESLVAARVALAAHKQGKYREVHEALMAHKGSFEKDALIEVAAGVGADPAKLAADMEDPAIMTQIQANDALAARLGITGTPGFIFGRTLVPGAISLDDMKKLVAEARAKAG
ncbi:MAG TPA: DsbA family protein [Dongiaceae bacterium]|nr:DsbA family protein [Dongiaceae bacterium]